MEICTDIFRLEIWAERNLREFKVTKVSARVLHLGRNDTKCQHRLGTDLLGSSSVEKDH